MTKLPSDIKPQKLLKILKRLGFTKVGSRGSHIRVKHKDGRWTQVAVHNKPIPRGTLHSILSQAKLSKEELEKLR